MASISEIMPAVENQMDTNSLVKNSIIKVKTTIPAQTQINFTLLFCMLAHSKKSSQLFAQNYSFSKILTLDN